MFGFYLIVIPLTAPSWKPVTELTLRANSTYNLRQLVTADSIAFRAGRTQPTGASLSDGNLFTIGTASGTAEFTATANGLESHIALEIDVIQTQSISRGTRLRYKVEIEGIDVSADLLNAPRVSENLDPIAVNETRINEATVVLRGKDTYDSNKAGNFWSENNLNAGGFQNAIKVYTEHFINNAWTENLLFSGIILESVYPIGRAEFRLNCVDASHILQNLSPTPFGNLTKWAETRKATEEETYQGIYTPESGLLPIQPTDGKAWTHQTEMTIGTLENPSEGPATANSGYLTAQDFRTAGGFVETSPLLEYKTLPRGADIESLFKYLAVGENHGYNIEIDLTPTELESPYILNRGSISHKVETTRNTLLPADWCYDGSADRILALLSHPEKHVQSKIVDLSLSQNTYRTLHTWFPKGTVGHRIARRNSANYYVLTSDAITQDRSAANLPRTSDKTGYAYDSRAEGSNVRIHHYNAATDVLTEFVPEDDDRPPQLGIHFHAGFENDWYIDEFEGIRPDFRGCFKWYSGNLYYRYCNGSEFGVARVNVSGTTSEMINQTTLNYHNWLNFAFDLTSGGDIYFVYAEGDAETSTLTIKRRTSGGTESTIFSETRGIGYFDELGVDFGAFLGCYEALFYDDHLYLLCPIQKADFGDDAQSVINPDVNIEQLTAEKTGERNVTTSTNLNPSNQTLAPGDDIPLRIDFDFSVSGATQDDLTVYGGTIESFSISSDMIDVTISPDSQTRHKTIIVDLAEDAVSQGNEAWRITIDFETARSRSKGAGMALYRCDVTAANPSLTVIETYDFVQCGGAGLTEHESAVHFVEGMPACEQYVLYNPDMDSYDSTQKQNTLSELDGKLKKYNGTSIEDLGFVFYEERPYNVFLSPLLSIGADLNLICGYGNPDAVLKYNSLASRADNFVHLVHTKTLKYTLPLYTPSSTAHAEISNLAKRVNATYSFEKNIIRVADRAPYRAKTDGATGTGTGNLAYDGGNKAFPTSGYLLIGGEVLEYTGTASGDFTGIVRGVLGTTIADHADNAAVLFLDGTIRGLGGQTPYLSISLVSDINRLYNLIRDSSNTVEVRDSASIAKYAERPFVLDLGLTRHENAWRSHIFGEYRDDLKDLQSIANLQIVTDFSLSLGNIVSFFHEDVLKAMRVVSVTYEENRTVLKGRTLTA